jgi:protein-disulfide isomerase
MALISLSRRGLFAALSLAVTLTAPVQAETPADKGKAMLEAASPLGDRVLGDPKAPVTLIEYASATCPHCAEVHKTLLPQIKKEYVDTGKVKFIFREFPLDQNALAVFMLVRCLPEEKFFPVTDIIFERQQSWAKAPNPAVEVEKIMAEAGMNKAAFGACLKNNETAKKMVEYSQKSAKDFGIKGTPALFVNGQFVDGHKDMTDVKKALDEAIAAVTAQ